MFELDWQLDSLQRSRMHRGLEASGRHHWPSVGESPSSCSGGAPLVAAEPPDPVIKETKVAGGSERAHNVDTGGGVVFWSPTSTLKMSTLGVCGSLSECLESLPFVCIVWWSDVTFSRSEWTSCPMTADADGTFLSVKWFEPFRSFSRSPHNTLCTWCWFVNLWRENLLPPCLPPGVNTTRDMSIYWAFASAKFKCVWGQK